MNRQEFIKNLLGCGLLASAGKAYPFIFSDKPFAGTRKFTLNYAPHFGMFKAHAGNNVISQLEFMAQSGFGALEDNNMRERSVDKQNKIAQAMERLGMQMGVFVAHTIGGSEPNLTSDNSDLHQKFIDEIKSSVAVAKRVNATWMT